MSYPLVVLTSSWAAYFCLAHSEAKQQQRIGNGESAWLTQQKFATQVAKVFTDEGGVVKGRSIYSSGIPALK